MCVPFALGHSVFDLVLERDHFHALLVKVKRRPNSQEKPHDQEYPGRCRGKSGFKVTYTEEPVQSSPNKGKSEPYGYHCKVMEKAFKNVYEDYVLLSSLQQDCR